MAAICCNRQKDDVNGRGGWTITYKGFNFKIILKCPSLGDLNQHIMDQH